jgi:GAF domain-containing protein
MLPNAGEPELIKDLLSISILAPVQPLLAEGIRSSIILPLVCQGNIIGTLNLGANQPNTFTADHVRVIREMIGPLAISIQQAQLREQVQRYAEELEQRVADRTKELARANEQLQLDITERQRSKAAVWL